MKAPSPLLAPRLALGDTIGFFSPSSPVTVSAPERFTRAKHFLEKKGFLLHAGRLTGQSDYYRSGTIQDRAAELNQLIRDPKVRCIMSTIGGNNSNALLPYIDYDALRQDPKIIIGYSDVTALLAGIYAKTGLITFYGPALVASFGELAPLVEHTYHSFHTICLTQPKLPYPYSLPEYWTDERLNWDHIEADRGKTLYKNQCEFIGSGTVQGRVLGGNLNTLSGIFGTPWMPSIHHGDILFIEDSLKNIATVERSFSHLKLSGIFDKVSAIILGKHEQFDAADSGRQPIDVLREVLGGQTIPIVNGFDCCHTHPMLTLPLGTKIKIDFDQRSISLIERYLT
ncbi:LD-carboxypeptidase [Rosenbergiella sp. S61]|uniref:LD-carboxypeptidase n=1 Tax=Rosenbergiella gaditana TaxID=2726987 RepID=A0ABS5SX89_9GAMM|nr:LD-carboxypeptidase [Rosenbergiella gaditana]